MILHFILARFSSSAEEDRIEEFLERVKAHNEKIPQVHSMEIGHHLERDEDLNQLPYGPFVSQAFPYCFLLRFDSVEALNTYLNHPDHEHLAEEFQGIVEELKVFDFIVSEGEGAPQASG